MDCPHSLAYRFGQPTSHGWIYLRLSAPTHNNVTTQQQQDTEATTHSTSSVVLSDGWLLGSGTLSNVHDEEDKVDCVSSVSWVGTESLQWARPSYTRCSVHK